MMVAASGSDPSFSKRRRTRENGYCLRTTHTKKLTYTSVVTEVQIRDGAERLRRIDHWYGGVIQGENHHLIEMIAGDATVDYPTNELVDRKQDRMVFWKNGCTPKQHNAPKAVASVSEEGQP